MKDDLLKLGTLVNFKLGTGKVFSGVIDKYKSKLCIIYAVEGGHKAQPISSLMLTPMGVAAFDGDLENLDEQIIGIHKKHTAKVSKGDYGYIIQDGEKVFGVITTGASGVRKAKMEDVAGEYEYAVPACQFFICDKPTELPEIPTELIGYKLLKFKHHSTLSQATTAFEAVIQCPNGNKLYLSNTGRGGCVDVQTTKYSDYEKMEADIYNAVKRIYPSEFGEFDNRDTVEKYVLWLGIGRNKFQPFTSAYSQEYSFIPLSIIVT